MKDQIRQRLEKLKEERQRFMEQAQQQIAGYNAAINELEQLLAPPQIEEPEAADNGSTNDD